jgi:Protein of unknown function (DUF2934)
MGSPTGSVSRIRAYELWELAGPPAGREDEFWYQAEKEIRETMEFEGIVYSPPPTVARLGNGVQPAAKPVCYAHFTSTT